MSTEPTPATAIVPGYAGHADVAARRLSDQQVRAWVGEILAGLRDRVPAEGLGDRFEALMMRCEFADQHVVSAVEDDAFAGPELVAMVESCDRALVDAARPGATTGPGGVPALIDAVERAFDARAAAIGAKLKR